MELDHPKKVSFHTLGCRLNFSETGSIAQGFAKRGYEIVDFAEPSDVVFINTCTVTDGADSSCRNLIRKAQRNAPEAKIVVAGCYAQMEADKIKQMQGVDLILGTSEKYKVFDYLKDEEENQVHIDQTNTFWGAATSLEEGHTRGFLKIQDGCNYVCSFCIIPQARGRSRTISTADAVSKARELVDQGFKELVLTGVNIGEYEARSGEKLTELIKRIQDIPGVMRLRLSSVEPNTITKELLEVLASTDQYQDHFHIPLQSADDAILKSMRRKYSIAQYKEIVDMVKSYFPIAGIGADVIVGYPGESEEQFQTTYDFLQDSALTHFHVFPYSKRKGTTAARLENHLQSEIKKFRVKSLMELGEQKLASLAESMVGDENEVLFERRNKQGHWEGYSSNFIRVLLESDLNLSNTIKRVNLRKSVGKQLIAEL